MKALEKQTPVPVLVALLVMLCFGCWIYYPGIHGPILLDDHSSLGALDNLTHSPQQVWDYVFGDKSGPLGRSVAMSSFVLEQLLGDGSTATTKLVNVGLHMLIGILVASFFALLLSIVKVPRVGLAAVAFAGVWLLAPLQVSTVLYLVQRMAMLATMFSLLSLIFYLQWRRGLSEGRARYRWLALSAISLLLGLFSKENAIVTIPLILLTEACWLQCKDSIGRRILWLQQLTYGLFVAGAIAVIVLLLVKWGYLEARHGNREFTLQERLLTQSRILWDYVGQFFLPELDRLGIYHDDFPLSRSLKESVTRNAVLAWCAVLFLCAVVWRWPSGRRLAYGPLFFLVGHSIESSVWPLELYFEHRNYLPVVGLAILPLTFYAFLVGRWRESGLPLIAWVTVFLVYLSALTSSQVQIWSKAPLVAMQTVNGHPESARANREYATQLARAGARETALDYSARAYYAALKYAAAGDEHHGDYILRDVALACIARQPLEPYEYKELGRYEPARPLGVVATMSVVVKLRQNETCPNFNWQGFQDHLANLYLKTFDTGLASANMYTALAMLANADQRWEDAHAYISRSLALSPGRTREMLMQLHFAIALGKEKEAEKLLVELQARRDAGKLNRGEQDTLALYLGPVHAD